MNHLASRVPRFLMAAILDLPRRDQLNGRLIGDVSGSIGMVLAICGIGLLPIQYLVWLKTDVWPAMHIRTVFDAMGVATPQGLDAVLKLPLSFAMLDRKSVV